MLVFQKVSAFNIEALVLLRRSGEKKDAKRGEERGGEGGEDIGGLRHSSLLR
jgi:hypothetical protein